MEIVLNVLGVGDKTFECETACVIELVARGLFQKANLQFAKITVFLIRSQHSIMGGNQAVMKTLDHAHRQDDKTVFVGLEGTKKGIGSIPDQIGIFLCTAANLVDFNFTDTHICFLRSWYQGRQVHPRSGHRSSFVNRHLRNRARGLLVLLPRMCAYLKYDVLALRST